MTDNLCLPSEFLTIHRSGILEPGTGVRLSEFRWLTLSEISSFQRPYYLSERLVPFAISPACDYFGWWKSADGSSYESVIWSPHDCDDAEVYSPDFTGFLYRIILNDLSDCWFAGQDNCGLDEVWTIMRRNVDRVTPFLPSTWSKSLADIVTNAPHFTRYGTVAWIERIAVDELVTQCFGNQCLGTIVKHHIDEPQPTYIGDAIDRSGWVRQIKEHPLANGLLTALRQHGERACEMIQIDRKAPCERIHNAIQMWMDATPRSKFVYNAVGNLGFLWGQIVCDELDWHWSIFTVGDDCPAYGIMSPDTNCILFPIQCIDKSIDEAKTAVNLYAVFEMLKSGDWSAVAKSGTDILYRSKYGHFIDGSTARRSVVTRHSKR